MARGKLYVITALLLLVAAAAGGYYYRNQQAREKLQAANQSDKPVIVEAASTSAPPPAPPPLDPAEIAKRDHVSIPIFMYHEVGEGPNNLYLAEKNLYAQMKYLHDNGYQTVTMAEARELLARREDTAKKVVLTFDDGYASFYNSVWPVLKEFNQTATFYVISGMVGDDRYVTWDQVKTLADNGIEIGGHTRTHPLLARIDPKLLDEEIISDKKDIETRIGRIITSFCYPTGSYNRQVIAKVKEAGYTTATTMEAIRASSKNDPFQLPRWGVFKQESLSVFTYHVGK